jgi:hypothetical protein
VPGASSPGAPGPVPSPVLPPSGSRVPRRLKPIVLVAVLAALGSGRVVSSGTEVRLDGGRVIVQATSVPLIDVLSRFSQATGAKIVYDAGKPRQLVTVAIDAASQAEALAQLLEGQGLSYAVRLDSTGQGVDMLFLMSKGQSASASAASAPAAPPPSRREMADVEERIENPIENDPGVVEGQEPTDNPDQGQPIIPILELDPTQGNPAPGAAPPTAPGAAGPQTAPQFPFATPWQPAMPAFPQAASYPAWR